jgi:hypothetical protein
MRALSTSRATLPASVTARPADAGDQHEFVGDAPRQDEVSRGSVHLTGRPTARKPMTGDSRLIRVPNEGRLFPQFSRSIPLVSGNKLIVRVTCDTGHADCLQCVDTFADRIRRVRLVVDRT